MSVVKEEVLFEMWSDGWDRMMPAILITYDDGSMDINIQTGDHHYKALEKVKNEFGFEVKEEMTGASGVYYKVEKVKEKKTRYEMIRENNECR